MIHQEQLWLTLRKSKLRLRIHINPNQGGIFRGLVLRWGVKLPPV